MSTLNLYSLTKETPLSQKQWFQNLYQEEKGPTPAARIGQADNKAISVNTESLHQTAVK